MLLWTTLSSCHCVCDTQKSYDVFGLRLCGVASRFTQLVHVRSRWHGTTTQHAFSSRKLCFTVVFHLQIGEMKTRALWADEHRASVLGRAGLGKSSLGSSGGAGALPWRVENAEVITTVPQRSVHNRPLFAWPAVSLVPSRTASDCCSNNPTCAIAAISLLWYLTTYSAHSVPVVASLCCHLIPPGPANPRLPRPRHRASSSSSYNAITSR